MKRIDMHTHTNASDGVFTATELIRYAHRKGMGGIAVTDHDTVEALSEARQAALEFKDFWMLPGIEFSTEDNNTEVHLLGYGINETDQRLTELLQTLKESRFNRAGKMVEKLKNLGIGITYDHVKKIAGDGVVGRLHIARVLVALRAVPTVQDAFQRYLNQGQPAYVPRYKLTPFDTIPLIHQLGGFSVLAHPALMDRDELIPKLIESGLMGLEAYYPTHSHNDVQRYLRLAYRCGLLVTGGSDFHAPPKQQIRESDLGQCSMPIEPIRRFYETLKNERKRENKQRGEFHAKTTS
jgi:3',5'-nucleoside bisphosphate phosphatase